MVLHKNVTLDEEHHSQLIRISILEKTSIKAVVQKWIDEDGRGRLKL